MKHILRALAHRPGRPLPGWSGLSKFGGTCELQWWYANVAPVGRGVGAPEPQDKAREVGTVVHLALAAWYRSGWREGDYREEAGMEAIAKHGGKGAFAATVAAESSEVFRRYVSECGPRGVFPDRDRFQVLAHPVAGEPLIECELTLELAPGWRMVSVVDVIGRDPRTEELLVVDHKTCSPRRLDDLMRELHHEPQFSLELLAARQLLGDALGPGRPVANIVRKVLKGRESTRTWLPLERSQADIDKHAHDALGRLQDLDASLGVYFELVERGADPFMTADATFDGSPSSYECGRCAFAAACANREGRGLWARRLTPRYAIASEV